MAQFLEAFQRRHPSPSGEPASPRRDRRVGKAGSLATAATLLLAVPGVALATMGNTGEGPNGGQHAPSIVRHGEGDIHPSGKPDWCLSGIADPGGRPPTTNSQVEVRPCAADNPFQHWNVAIEEEPGEPDKMIAQLRGFNLCLAANLIPSRHGEIVPVRLDDCNSPLSTLHPKEMISYWQISTPDSAQVVSVPAELSGRAPYPVAIWIDFAKIRRAEGENTLFELPNLSAGRGGGGSLHPSVL